METIEIIVFYIICKRVVGQNRKEGDSYEAIVVYLTRCNAATTQPFPEVLDAMIPYYSRYYGNPSSGYELGEEANAMSLSREVDRRYPAGCTGNDLFYVWRNRVG